MRRALLARGAPCRFSIACVVLMVLEVALWLGLYGASMQVEPLLAALLVTPLALYGLVALHQHLRGSRRTMVECAYSVFMVYMTAVLTVAFMLIDITFGYPRDLWASADEGPWYTLLFGIGSMALLGTILMVAVWAPFCVAAMLVVWYLFPDPEERAESTGTATSR